MPAHLSTASQPIAIVGIGCAFPKAPSVNQYWQNIKHGRDGISDVPESHWPVDAYYDRDPDALDMTYGRRGGFLDPAPFDTLQFGIAPRNLEATDTTQLFSLLAARDALLDAGYALDPASGEGKQFDRARACVILGVTGALELVIPLGARLGHPQWRAGLLASGVEPAVAEEVVRRIGDEFIGWQENSFPGLLGNVAAGRVANRFDFGGTNCVVDAACASSLGAVHLALLELASGRADIALSGGVDTFNDIFMYMCFSKTPALSPTGDSRPFDHNGDGTILGEGAGVLVLKRLEDAIRDGDNVRAVIKGIGSSSDGRGNAIYAPSSSGQERAIRTAYADAGIGPETIELFEAHGTGTRVGDATEVDALTKVFASSGRDGTWCALGSVKSMIGHTKAAAGIAGLIKVVLALESKVLPPTIKVERPLSNLAPGSGPVYLNTHARPWSRPHGHPRRAALSAFGFGGSNFHCVLEEHGSEKTNSDWSGDVIIAGASGQDANSAVDALVSAIAPALQSAGAANRNQDRWRHLRAVARASLMTLEPQAPARALVVLQRTEHDFLTDVKTKLALLSKMASESTESGFAHSNGTFVGTGPIGGKLGALFPGQGSQHPNMLKDLACVFPAFIDLVATGDDALGKITNAATACPRLSDVLFPQPVFDDSARKMQTDRLRDTRFAQPALAIVELGAWSVLEGFGVQPSAVGGHSFGEICALVAGKRLTPEEALKLAVLRGQLMAGNGSDRGGMLAVPMAAGTLTSWLEGRELDVVIANFNGPTQTVLSGPTPAIDSTVKALTADGKTGVRLPVSAAFHSHMMADAAGPFRAALDDLPFGSQTAAAATVYANHTGKPYPSEPSAARNTLGEQITNAVHFAGMVENMHAAGIRTFIEIGPGRVLSNIVRSVFQMNMEKDGDVHVLTLDASSGNQPGEADLAVVLASLAALGHEVCLERVDTIDPTYVPPETTPAVVYITGANQKPLQPANMRFETPPRPDTSEVVPPTEYGGHVSNPETISHAESTAAISAPRETPPDANADAIDRLIRGSSTVASAGMESIVHTLAKMHAQTAKLHQQYLDTVAQMHASIERLTLSPGPVLPTKTEITNLETTIAEHSDKQTLLPTDTEKPASSSNASSLTSAAIDAVFEIVADKTGYPIEMLSASMELDTDLGIDSIKRVEILSALQDRVPALAEPTPQSLSALTTLDDVASLIADVGTQPPKVNIPPTTGNAGVTPVQHTKPDSTEEVTQLLLSTVSEKTGYPLEILELDMQLDADLGIDSIKRVEILSAMEVNVQNAEPIDPQAVAELITLHDVVVLLNQTISPEKAVLVDSVNRNTTGAGAVKPHSTAQGNESDLSELLLRVVAEKTGYPAEMLSLGMHLDADLGIDSIKRVEILAALEQESGVSALAEPEALAALDTLDAVLEILADSETRSTSSVTSPPLLSNGEVDVIESPAAEPSVLDILVPQPAPLSAKERPLLNFSPQAELLIVADDHDLSNAIQKALSDRNVEGRVVSWSETDNIASGQCPAGVLFVYPATPQLPAVSLLARAISLLARLAPQLHTSSSGDRLVAAVTRLGGEFGLSASTEHQLQAESACLSGLVKSVAVEWPDTSCKVVDLSASVPDTAALTRELVDELLHRGPLEVGLIDNSRVELAMVPWSFPPSQPRRPKSGKPLVLLTGGGRGITASVALEIAKREPCTAVLLGRTNIDVREPSWLSQLSPSATEAAITRTLSQHSDFATPTALKRAARDALARRQIRATLAEFHSLGLPAFYRNVDVQDSDALSSAISELTAEFGAIHGLVHGAGVISDSLIEDKTLEGIATVFNTKVRAFETLCAFLDEAPAWVGVFSSSSARLGRRGQADYAAANEVLNKQSQVLKQRFPKCQIISFNWGPWDTGMVGPELAKMFSDEGIGIIESSNGATLAANSLLGRSNAAHPVELVVSAPTTEPAETQRDNKSQLVSSLPLEEARSHTVSFDALPVLTSHVLGGQGVLPLVISAEWLVQGAMHNNPGLYFHGFDDLRVLAPVKVGLSDSLEITCAASLCTDHAQALNAVATLSCSRPSARAQVILSPTAPPEPRGRSNTAPAIVGLPDAWCGRELYDGKVLFHGPLLRGISALESMNKSGLIAQIHTASAPGTWCARPGRSSWVTDPLAIDAGFQLMVIWCLEYMGAHSLPTYVATYRQFVPSFPKEGAKVEVHIDAILTNRVLADLSFTDHDGRPLAQITGYECVVDQSLKSAFANNSLQPHPATAAGDD